MKKNKLFLICAMIVTFAATIAGYGAAKTEQAPVQASDKNTVFIQNFKFQPAEITIRKGETITWNNQDSVAHTVTGSAFQSELLSTGQSFSQIFSEEGTFEYICKPHPYMKGKIIVQ